MLNIHIPCEDHFGYGFKSLTPICSAVSIQPNDKPRAWDGVWLGGLPHQRCKGETSRGGTGKVAGFVARQNRKWVNDDQSQFLEGQWVIIRHEWCLFLPWTRHFLHFFHKREQRLISQWKNKLFISCLSRVPRICLAPMEFDDGRSTGDHAMILIGFHGLNHFRFNLPCGKTWHWTIAPISAHWVRGFPSHFGLAEGISKKRSDSRRWMVLKNGTTSLPKPSHPGLHLVAPTTILVGNWNMLSRGFNQSLTKCPPAIVDDVYCIFIQ